MSSNGQESKRRKREQSQETDPLNRRPVANPAASPSSTPRDRSIVNEYYEYHSDSEPELYGDELEADRRVFNSATERERHTATELVRCVTLITEQCAEHGPAILQQTLCLLGQYFPGIPKDPRTALEGLTGPWNIETTEVQGGVYWHRGLEAGMQKVGSRTNAEFRCGVYASTHQQVADGQPVVTPLARLPIDIVQDVTIGDDCQLLHLGVAKTLFFAFVNGLVRLPHERQPRRFGKYIVHWPHTLWGSFLDAVGIVILKHVISQEHYMNFCLLHWAIAICNSTRYRHLLNYARRLLHQFVTEHQNMVGYVTDTFHQLLHLVDEVVKFGPLPLQSASPFKAAVSGLNHKVDITKTAPPMQQIARALLLREAACRPFLPKPLPPIPIPTNNGRRVKIREQFVLRCESISADDTDSWFLAPGGQVVKFQKASADPFVVYGQALTERVASFIHPVTVPDELTWFAAKDKAKLQNTTEYRLKDIICKLYVIWTGGYTAFVPLTESFAES